MSKDEFKEEYGEIPISLSKEIDFAKYDWYAPDLVYIAEYYLVETKKEVIRIFSNITGSEEKYTEEEFEENPGLEEELAAIGTKEVRQKKIKRRKIHKYILSGNGILEDCDYIAGKNIPIIPTYGKRWVVDSVERCMGHVRLVKDTQRLKNMLTSKLAEISSLSTVQKPIFTPEQVLGHETRWAEDNITNYPYMLLNPITDISGNPSPVGAIGYTKAPEISPALAALMQIVDIDQKELLGNSGEAEKMLSHVSGKAHELVQKSIDGQAFIYMSNFAKAIKRAGEVWLSMAKDVYVEKGRKMKTIDTSGQTSTVELLALGVNESGGVTEKNDLTKATFDVSVDVGPSSASQRDATVQAITGMLAITQNPDDAKVLQNLAMMNMEGDGISDVREYYRKNLVKLGVVQPTEEEAKEMEEAAKNAQPDANEQALLAMAAESTANAKNKEAEVLETQANTAKIKAETLNTLDEINISKLQAAQAYIKQVAEIKQKQQAALQQQQQQQAALNQTQQTPSVS